MYVRSPDGLSEQSINYYWNVFFTSVAYWSKTWTIDRQRLARRLDLTTKRKNKLSKTLVIKKNKTLRC